MKVISSYDSNLYSAERCALSCLQSDKPNRNKQCLISSVITPASSRC